MDDSVICKGSVSLGTACGECSKCRAVPSQVWANKIREMQDEHSRRIEEMREEYYANLKKSVAQVEEVVAKQMLSTAVNCGQSSVCSVAGWFMEDINKKKLEQKEPE